ncbi:ribonuclease H-like domain-containing protein [Tanacetum coccineum]
MTDPTKDIFNVVNIYSLILTVCHPNGTLAKNTAIGSLRLTSGIVLFDVLVVLEYNLWHCRLGHLADQVLSILGKKIGFSRSDHISPCDICHKAKQTREPFPLNDHKSVCVGDLVHCDVLGSLHGDYRAMAQAITPKSAATSVKTSESGPVPSRLLLLEFCGMVVGNYRIVVEKDWYATFVVEVGIVERALGDQD